MKKIKQRQTLKTYLFTGILVTAPVAITLYLSIKLFLWLDSWATKLIPAKYNPETYLPYGLPGLGVLILLIFLILVGMLTANYVGRWLVGIGQGILGRVPVISGIYSALKKLFETVMGNNTQAFRKAVLVEYPRKGMWTVAFITAPVYAGFKKMLPKDMVTLYVPTTPNPTSGFMVYVPKKDIKELNVSVEEAFKMILSMGIVNPSKKP